MKNNILSVIGLSLTLSLLTSCAPRIGGNDYALGGVGEISTSKRGVIVGARPVNVSSASKTEGDNKPGVGAGVGAVSGGVLGAQIGKGRTPWITGALGALAGGVAGHFAERGLTDQQGIEYQVQLDHGDIITIVQGPDTVFAVGQRVFVVQSGRDRSRVVADNS